MLDAARRSAEINPGKLPALFKKQFQLCNVKPGETIAIVSDPGTRDEYIHAAFAAAEILHKRAKNGRDADDACSVSATAAAVESAAQSTIK